MDPSKYLSDIATQGTLGTLLAISLIVNGVLFRLLAQSWEKRITDLAQILNANSSVMSSVKQTVDLILTVVQERGRRT